METSKTHPQTQAEHQKQAALEALCEGPPDAVFLLSGVSEITDPETGQKSYKPGSYADVDWKGFMTGGKARAIAVVEIAEYFPDALVAVNSNTFNIHDPSAPTDAEVMAKYIVGKGVNPERVLEQAKSTTTFTELIELIKYAAKYEWRHAVVVAGETQKLRAEEMFKQLDTLEDPDGASKDSEFRAALAKVQELGTKITFVSSEDVLPIRDPRYEGIISAAKKSATWIGRETLDQKAYDDLVNGRYWKDIYQPTAKTQK